MVYYLCLSYTSIEAQASISLMIVLTCPVFTYSTSGWMSTLHNVPCSQECAIKRCFIFRPCALHPALCDLFFLDFLLFFLCNKAVLAAPYSEIASQDSLCQY